VLEVAGSWPAAKTTGGIGLPRFAHLLPGGEDLVSLGEGDTPLLRSRRIGPRLGIDLWFKNETVNPTWSYKDRYVAVSIGVARSLGYDRIAVSSTGNLGVSVAAYAAAAGMRCIVIIPDQAPRAVFQQAGLYGADVLITDWEARLTLFEHLALERGWFPIGLFLPRRVSNPFGIEGYKTIAYELIEQLGQTPAAVLFPSARGNGLFGTWKGFLEAKQSGRTQSTPRLVACQPAGADSLRVSLQQDAPSPVELPQIASIAFSTMEGLADGRALDALRASQGTALAASDPEILDAVAALGGEGLFVEPSSALPVACLTALIETGLVERSRPIVCVLTSAGSRWAEQVPPIGPEPTRLDASVASLDRWLAQRETTHG